MEYCGASETEIQLSLCNPLHADPEARWASWQRAHQAGILTANEVREEEGWQQSDDPLADTLAPPNTSAAAVPTEDTPLVPRPPPPDKKVARKLVTSANLEFNDTVKSRI
jgi:hypothetical protein